MSGSAHYASTPKRITVNGAEHLLHGSRVLPWELIALAGASSEARVRYAGGALEASDGSIALIDGASFTVEEI